VLEKIVRELNVIAVIKENPFGKRPFSWVDRVYDGRIVSKKMLR